MAKNIIQALPELVEAAIISPATADQIRDYYRRQDGKPANVLFIVFGILGALSVGLGIILILAHNWDTLPRATKTGLAFVPLVLGQLLGLYALLRQAGSPAWRESAAPFLFLAVGASIALVGQIYHITSTGGTFLLTWMLLGLPLVYLLRSSVVSLLFIGGITYYAVQTGSLFSGTSRLWFYWLLLMGILPHYYYLFRHKPGGNFTFFHHWFLPLSAAVALFTVGENTRPLLVPAYGSLFSLYSLLGYSKLFRGQKRRNNGYLVVGTLGTLGLLLVLSFDSFWLGLAQERWAFPRVMTSPEGMAAAIVSLLAGGLLVARYRHQSLLRIQALEITFVVIILAFISAFFFPVAAAAVVNLVVLGIGLQAIRQGARSGDLGRLNSGLLLVAALVTCRFFDTDLSFVFRGIVFVLLGIGFFYTNYWMLQKRKTHEH
jgi:uncharacterized membrane protein